MQTVQKEQEKKTEKATATKKLFLTIKRISLVYIRGEIVQK